MLQHTNKPNSRLPFPRRVIVISVFVWILLAGAWTLYLLSGHKPLLATNNLHPGYSTTSILDSVTTAKGSVTTANTHLRNADIRLSANTVHQDVNTLTTTPSSVNEVLEMNNKVHTLQRNLAMKENEITQLHNQLSKLENDLKHYKNINKELTQEQKQKQEQKTVQRHHLSEEPSVQESSASFSLSSTLMNSKSKVPPSVQLRDVLRPYIFPQPKAQNAARSAWIRGMLDWHNLVPDVYAIKDNDQATFVLQRIRREKAKEQLLELVNGWNAPRSLPWIDSNGMIKSHSIDLQTEILQQLYTSFPVLQTIPKLPSISETDQLSTIVSNTTIITSITRMMHLDGDNIDDYRTPQKDYGPLGKMMACGKIRDPCLLHSSPRACVDDEYCGWCSTTNVCVDRLMGYWPEKQAGNKVLVCPDPLVVTAESVPDEFIRRKNIQNPSTVTNDIRVQLFNPKGSDRSVNSRPVHPSACSFIITRRRPIVLAFNNGNSKMAFHFFTETAPNWFQAVTNLHGSDYLNLDTYVPQATWNEFPQMITPFSDSCPRILEEISKRNISICYEHLSGPTVTSRHRSSSSKVTKEGSSNEQPKENKAVVDKRRRLLTLSDLNLVDKKEVSLTTKESAEGAEVVTNKVHSSQPITKSSPESTALNPESVFGLRDPDLLWIDPVNQRIVNMNDGGNDIPLSSSSGSVKEKHRPSLSLESVTDTIIHGKRIGLAGLATLITYYGDNPYWSTKEGQFEIQRCTGTNELSSSSIQSLSTKLSSRLLRTPYSFPELLLNLLLLQDEGTFDNEKPLVTFISRKNKRFIFNEADLIRIALGFGARVAVIALESTPLYEQLTILRRTSILVGMHGSGLINSPIMRPGGVVLQLIPYGVRGASGFFQPTATSSGMEYNEIGQSDRKKTVPHYHFLDNSHAKDYESMFTSSSGSEGSNQAVFFSFWINQDGYVDTLKFGRALRTSFLQLEQSKSKRKEKEVEKVDQTDTNKRHK